MQADIDFSNATTAHRIDAWVAAFAPNGSQIARDGKLVTGHEAGKETVSHGRYLTIWKKQSDGTWKILFDLGDPDPKR